MVDWTWWWRSSCEGSPLGPRGIKSATTSSTLRVPWRLVGERNKERDAEDSLSPPPSPPLLPPCTRESHWFPGCEQQVSRGGRDWSATERHEDSRQLKYIGPSRVRPVAKEGLRGSEIEWDRFINVIHRCVGAWPSSVGRSQGLLSSNQKKPWTENYVARAVAANAFVKYPRALHVIPKDPPSTFYTCLRETQTAGSPRFLGPFAAFTIFGATTTVTTGAKKAEAHQQSQTSSSNIRSIYQEQPPSAQAKLSPRTHNSNDYETVPQVAKLNEAPNATCEGSVESAHPNGPDLREEGLLLPSSNENPLTINQRSNHLQPKLGLSKSTQRLIFSLVLFCTFDDRAKTLFVVCGYLCQDNWRL